jgi:hypothetical protein
MDPSNPTWSKPLKPMHSMPLSWIESLAHLEYIMGPRWCLWADPHYIGWACSKHIGQNRFNIF